MTDKLSILLSLIRTPHKFYWVPRERFGGYYEDPSALKELANLSGETG